MTAVENQFTVLTYNIHTGKGIDGIRDLNRIGLVLEQSQTDLIGLQEVDGNADRSCNVDQSAYLANHLKIEYHYAPALTTPFLYGNAILSKFPILAKENLIMKKTETAEDRSVAVTKVRIANQSITFIATHLSLADKERLEQVKFIADYVRSVDTPVVVVGDWNSEPGSPAYKTITRQLVDAAAFMGLTAPTFRGFPLQKSDPGLCIDYVFVSEDIKVHSVEVIDTPASDHFPVKALLSLKTT